MAEEAVEVWPCCWSAVGLFLRMGTQWRIGMSGPAGLDYNVLLALLDRMELAAAEFDELLDDIRVLESAALDEMHRK